MTSFGDPNAPKFCYGQKGDSAVNHDLNWRNQIAKEKREMKQNAIRNAVAKGTMSARLYHPTHVPDAGQNPLGRIRLGVCGTFIHEDGPPERAPSRSGKRRGVASGGATARSGRNTSRTARTAGGGAADSGSRRRSGELDRAGGLTRYAETGAGDGLSARSRRGATARSVGAAVASARSARSTARSVGSRRSYGSSASSIRLRERLEEETKARLHAEEKITLLALELQRLKASLALRK